MTINLPREVEYIINRLYQSGYEAFAVGGCVRDSLLDRVPNDWDIATDAQPDVVMQLFKDLHTIPTGLNHGTVTLVMNGSNFETTTYRIDGEYSDNRRPDRVDFTQSIEDDLKRRDFTINAMAYNNKQGLIDFFGGQEDLKNKIIRCVGDANERFSEDALRMLRAVRFSAQLGFSISYETKNAIIQNARLLNKVSRERIRSEFEKILISEFPGRLQDLVELGLIEEIIPEFSNCKGYPQKHPYHVYSVDEHIYKVVENVRNDVVLRWAAFLHDIGKPECRTVDEKGIDHFYGHNRASARIARKTLHNLRVDNDTINKVVKLVLNHDLTVGESRKSICKWLNKLGKQGFARLLELRAADISAQNPVFYESSYSKLNKIKSLYKNIIENEYCYSIQDLAIDGEDLKRIGCKEGKEIGRVLKRLLDIVMEDPDINTKEKLIEKVKLINRLK